MTTNPGSGLDALDALVARDAMPLGALGFARRELRGGDVPWKADEPADELAWASSGELTRLMGRLTLAGRPHARNEHHRPAKVRLFGTART